MRRTAVTAVLVAAGLMLGGCADASPIGGGDHEPPVLSSSKLEVLLVSAWVRSLNEPTPSPGAPAQPTASTERWVAQCGDWDERSAAEIEDLPCELTPADAGEPVPVLVTVQGIDGWQGYRVVFTRT